MIPGFPQTPALGSNRAITGDRTTKGVSVPRGQNLSERSPSQDGVGGIQTSLSSGAGASGRNPGLSADPYLISSQKYRTIVADPPWDVKAGPRSGEYKVVNGKQVWNLVSGTRTRDLAYPPMTVDEIAGLNVPAAPDAHLYLWTINKYVDAAYDVARAWGFVPSTLLVWAKTPFGGGGLGGTWRITTEFCLFARRGSLAATGHHIGTWFNIKREYDERGKPQHSRKPAAFLDLIEQVSPGPYLEMFSRRSRLGWDTWGDEALNHVELSA